MTMADDDFIPDDDFVPESIGQGILGGMAKEAAQSWGNIKEGFGTGNTERLIKETQEAPWYDPRPTLGYWGRLGKSALSAVSAPFQAIEAPIAGGLAAGEQYISGGYDPEKLKEGLRSGLSKDAAFARAKETPEETYARWRKNLDFAFTALPSGKPITAAPGPLPATGPFGVVLSEGQATGELPLIQREQAALKEKLGAGARDIAKEFQEQQSAQVAQAQKDISRGLDPYGFQVAENPQKAGEIIQESLKTEAARAKAYAERSYKVAEEMGGEIHPGVFENMGSGIRSDLYRTENPIIIDDLLTPYASRMLTEVDKEIARMRVQNRADPYMMGKTRDLQGMSEGEDITGLTLQGVNQMRKRLSQWRNAAWKNNDSDGRAASSIVDAFDSRIDSAIDKGMFFGDPRAIQAWKDARAAHADYKGTFTAGRGDPIGRVVENILGKRGAEATPNAVANHLYGSSEVNPKSLNVGVTKRIRDILGEQSPEWSAVRQGLFSRLVEVPEGAKEKTPGQIAERLSHFLNGKGKEMSELVFTPEQRTMLQRYADLQRTIDVPVGGANMPSQAKSIIQRLSGWLGIGVGTALAHKVGLGWFYSEAAGLGFAKGIQKLGEMSDAHKIAKQMPNINRAMANWIEATERHARFATPQTKAAEVFAAGNLSKTLKPLGAKLDDFMTGVGPQMAPAAEQQENQIEGKGSQKKHGGKVGKPKAFIHAEKLASPRDSVKAALRLARPPV